MVQIYPDNSNSPLTRTKSYFDPRIVPEARFFEQRAPIQACVPGTLQTVEIEFLAKLGSY